MNEIIEYNTGSNASNYLSPVVNVQTALTRYQDMKDFIDKVLNKDVDYGSIPGTSNKAVLLKPGAEKLAAFFGLTVTYDIIEKVADWTARTTAESRSSTSSTSVFCYETALWQDKAKGFMQFMGNRNTATARQNGPAPNVEQKPSSKAKPSTVVVGYASTKKVGVVLSSKTATQRLKASTQAGWLTQTWQTL